MSVSKAEKIPQIDRVSIQCTVIGFSLTGILFHLVWEGRDLQEALLPFLFMVGALTAWIAGHPLDWAVSAIYMMIEGLGRLLLFDTLRDLLPHDWRSPHAS